MGTIEKCQDGFYYTSEKGVVYTLLVGESLGANYTSDICFIMYITDEVTKFVNFVYGASIILEDIEQGKTEEWENAFSSYVSEWEKLNIK